MLPERPAFPLPSVDRSYRATAACRCSRAAPSRRALARVRATSAQPLSTKDRCSDPSTVKLASSAQWHRIAHSNRPASCAIASTAATLRSSDVPVSHSFSNACAEESVRFCNRPAANSASAEFAPHPALETASPRAFRSRRRTPAARAHSRSGRVVKPDALATHTDSLVQGHQNKLTRLVHKLPA